MCLYALECHKILTNSLNIGLFIRLQVRKVKGKTLEVALDPTMLWHLSQKDSV
jgi:hypothetical protein